MHLYVIDSRIILATGVVRQKSQRLDELFSLSSPEAYEQPIGLEYLLKACEAHTIRRNRPSHGQ